MTSLNLIATKECEQVAFFHDRKTGLRAIIAVHDTTLGPSLGGCRMRSYTCDDDALFDVLHLAEGMTFKNALAGLNIGGGKSVIIVDSQLTKNREAVFSAFARFVSSLNGRYITAEDMGTSVSDMKTILKSCPYVTGRPESLGGGGDPSPFTAQGVMLGMRACLERLDGSGEFKGRTIAIQGVGHVGWHLASLLAEAGARLTVADTKSESTQKAQREFGAAIVPPDVIMGVECDIFSPCAVGGVINSDTYSKLRCKIVAGAANNQIYGDQVEAKMVERGIMYAPDFAINAGGVINCAAELEDGGYNRAWVMERVSQIYHTVGRIIDDSKRTGELPGSVAIRLARKRIESQRSRQGD